MDTYKILLHYGEIVADKNHETVDGNFIRFTTFKYNNTYFIATLFNGDVISVAEKELEEQIMHEKLYYEYKRLKYENILKSYQKTIDKPKEVCYNKSTN